MVLVVRVVMSLRSLRGGLLPLLLMVVVMRVVVLVAAAAGPPPFLAGGGGGVALTVAVRRLKKPQGFLHNFFLCQKILKCTRYIFT